MKNLIKISLVLSILILIALSCDDNETIVTVEENNVLARVTVAPYANNLELHYYGDLITNKVCPLNYIVLNMDTVWYDEPTPYYRNDNDGYIEFSVPYETQIQFEDTVNLEIHTGVGMIGGSGIIPDSIKNISFNLVDTVEIKETLSMNFNGNADYYWIRYEYRYLSEDSTWILYKSGKIFTNENEVYFDSTSHPKNGYLKLFSILSVNGPLPEVNSLPNMFGDGKGYLYSVSGLGIDVEFVIGEGFEYPMKKLKQENGF